jgi:hypothetical protein
MFRINSIAALAIVLGLQASAADSATINNWLHYGNTDAANAVPASTETTIGLVGSDKKGSTFWAVFDPIPLATEKPVTLSCRVRTPDDLPTNSTSQIRIGLYGVVSGTSPATTKQTELRGFAVMGGSMKKLWRVDLAEHATGTGPLIYAAGMTNRAMTEAESTGGRGAESRIVITITKKTADSIRMAGFWGDVPFLFEVKPLAGDYTHLRAIAVMRGGNSGTGEMTIGNVKIRPD